MLLFQFGRYRREVFQCRLKIIRNLLGKYFWIGQILAVLQRIVF